MTMMHFLYSLTIQPLVLLFELIYGVSASLLRDSALAIIPLSVAVNLFSLPLYLRADAIQKENRQLEKKMEPWVKHIRAHFSGDERYMITKTYYRICGYKPIYALRNSASILLQIPFFVAAYRMLSNLPALQGRSFGPIADLAAPDGLLVIGETAVNLLPFMMTLIHLITSIVYCRQGAAKKEMAQMMVLSLVFLVMLYRSPSGLVLYWALNQLFSLYKTAILTMDDRGLKLCLLTAAAGAVTLVFSIVIYFLARSLPVSMLLFGVLCELPIAARAMVLNAEHRERRPSKTGGNQYIFLCGAIYLTILTGALIPSAVVRSSPKEFINLLHFRTPLIHVVNASLAAFGSFVIWGSILYYFLGKEGERRLTAFVWILSGVASLNYFFFGTKLGRIHALLQYAAAPVISRSDWLMNLAAVLLTVLVMLWIFRKHERSVLALQFVLILTCVCMTGLNIHHITKSAEKIHSLIGSNPGEKASFGLSKDGNNVVVIMMDRAINSFIPFIFEEKPDLKEKFDGFTWYSNTVSFSNYTNTGSPALFGGYEYTPSEINKRANDTLKEKHNEALKVMPVLFHGAGYDVTVIDPPYAGYEELYDLSIYDEYPNIRAYNTSYGQYSEDYDLKAELRDKIWERSFFCYSIMKISPLILHNALYHYGTYYNPQSDGYALQAIQLTDGVSRAKGKSEYFMTPYDELSALKEMTEIRDEGNTFLLMTNKTTHDGMLLSEPDYIPETYVDNTQYDFEHRSRFTLDGRTLKTETNRQMSFYHSNMAAMIQLGSWFDYLREQGVYDNTRIIIVSDHGNNLGCFEDLMFGEEDYEDAMWYHPLLLVKDYESHGFTKSDAFMTNADTPAIAFRELIEDPVNPFTGKRISDDGKNAERLMIYHSHSASIIANGANNGCTFIPGDWYALKNHTIFDRSNWEYDGFY